MSKQIIIDLIEQGFSDREIANKTGKNYKNVQVVRSNYNKVVDLPISSKRAPLKQPKPNTQCRRLYDFLKANPTVTPYQAAVLLDVESGVAQYVFKRYIQSEASNSTEEKEKIAELQDRVKTLDKGLTGRMQRTGEIEELLLKMANGKLALPNQQDCRVLALRLGTPKNSWSDTVKNHQFSQPDGGAV